MKSSVSNAFLTRKRWIILTASCIVNLCIGAIYAWSVFSGPMAEYLNGINGTSLTSADLAVVFSVANGVAFITMILGGYLDDKIGSKMIILIGVVIFGLGMIVSGLAKSVGILNLGFGLMCGPANGFAYVCTVSNTVKLFPDKKGLAGGLCTASIGISSVVIPPIANVLNNAFGVCRAFIIFGVVIVVLGTISSLFIVNCPDDFVPAGWKKPEEIDGLKVRDIKSSEMIRMPVFYIMLIILTVGCCLGLMIISDVSGVAQAMIGTTATTAAVIVSVLALANTAGRIVAGWISDKIGRANTLIGVFLVSAIALVMIYISGGFKSVLLFATGICLMGICYGAFMGVYPGFTTDRFGLKYSTLNYGIMFIGFSAAGFIGPLLMQGIFNRLGSYRPAFLAALVFSAVGIALMFVYKKAISKAKLESE